MILGWLLFVFVLLFSLIQAYLYLNINPVLHPPVVLQRELPSVTVVVPMRNEAKHISKCLESLIRQEYPEDKYEILVVDDHSDDGSGTVISEYPVRLILQNEGRGGKKEAVITGVHEAKGEIVLMTDADCIAGPEWVVSMVGDLLSEDARMVIGPVTFVQHSNISFIQRYQVLEQNALNVITAAGLKTGLISSASGANMGFYKETFYSLNPYEDNNEIASGDDVFFAQKMKKHQMKVVYCKSKDAVVFSEAVRTFPELIRQRVRWGSKSKFYSHRPTQFYLLLFILSKLSLVLLLLFSFFNSSFWNFFFFGLIFQFISDYILIQKGMRWVHRAVCWQDVLKASLFQVFLTIYISVVVLMRPQINWKGRSGQGVERR